LSRLLDGGFEAEQDVFARRFPREGAEGLEKDLAVLVDHAGEQLGATRIHPDYPAFHRLGVYTDDAQPAGIQGLPLAQEPIWVPEARRAGRPIGPPARPSGRAQ